MPKRVSFKVVACAAFCSALLFGQDAGADPPNTANGSGQSVAGAFSLSNIESINSLSGIVTLNIPAAHLPPGPGGFSFGLNLVYNSSIFDLATEVATSQGEVEMDYVPSAHGGGWNYGYNYVLWSQTRITSYNANVCQNAKNITNTEAEYWYKTILLTPDGVNHPLILVGALDQNGNQTTTPPFDPNTLYGEFDFAGYFNANCSWGYSQPVPSTPAFSGTLIYATADNTFIRVEANTVSRTWTAFLPNGTRVSGAVNINQPVQPPPHAIDSDATSITDRNGNSLAISQNCAEGTACTTTLSDVSPPVVKSP